jgi:DNA modification methylase
VRRSGVHARILVGHVLEKLRSLPDGSVRCAVTSPPYWGLRDYGTPPVTWPAVLYRPIEVPGVPEISILAMACSLGQESTIEAFIGHLVLVFREVRRVLADDGTLWLNIGDSYNSGPSGGLGGSRLQGGQQSQVERRKAAWRGVPRLQHKDMLGIPWRLAFALQADGWIFRQDVIWQKPNPMPESVRDRCTKAHEYVFLFAKSQKYFYDAAAMKEPAVIQSGRLSRGSEHDASIDADLARNRRSVWTVATKPYDGAHFATFPPELVVPSVLAGSAPGDTVLDPFSGTGTTGAVATGCGRSYIGCELNPEYADLSRERIGGLITTIDEAAA